MQTQTSFNSFLSLLAVPTSNLPSIWHPWHPWDPGALGTGAMWAVPGAWHRRQLWGAGGCDPPPVELGSCTVGKGKALPTLLLPDTSLLVGAGASMVFLGCTCRFPCAVCAEHISFSRLCLCSLVFPSLALPRVVAPRQGGFVPVSLRASLAPGLHWSVVPGNAREGGGEH